MTKKFHSYFVFFSIKFLILQYSYTQTNISGVINTYTKITSIVSLGCNDTLIVVNSTGFSVGDSVLIIQMQGASIDITNSSSFGNILNYNNSGNFEFAKISLINGNIIRITSSLKKNYDVAGNVQLITVPYYNDAIVSGTLSASEWNGTTGGVLVFSVANSLSLNGNIDLSGKGFRGGTAPNGNFNCGQMNYYYSSSSLNGGQKGEGIANYISGKEYGRGCQANGGGGGNNNNAGGAGGGNFSLGGRGGNQVEYGNCTPLQIGGESGKNLVYSSTADKLFIGGGGGSGHQNDNNNVGIHGKNGGGMILINAGSISGNSFSIISNGDNNSQSVTTDGAGGGGAGGTIFINTNSFSGSLNITAKGGNGGNSSSSIYCMGVGGGGSGGAIVTNNSFFPASVSINVQGGATGINSISNNSCSGSNWGAQVGQDGGIIYDFILPVSSFYIDAGIDKTICSNESVQIGTPEIPGIQYNWNNGVANIAQPIVNPVISTTYVLSASIGCDTLFDTVNIFVNPSPVADFNFTYQCNDSVKFVNNSTDYTSSVWDFGDGNLSNLDSPAHLYADAGVYSIGLIVNSAENCTDTLIKSITSEGFAQAEFNVVFDTCTLIASCFNTSLGAQSYLWIFSDSITSNEENPVHTFQTTGFLSVTLIINQGSNCPDTFIQAVEIPELVVDAGADTTICENDSLQIGTPEISGIQYNWNNGAITAEFIVKPLATTTYVLIATLGCDTAYDTVTVFVNPSPIADFDFITPCSNSIQFINNSIGNDSSYWEFGNSINSSEDNPTNEYLTYGNYNVTLIVISLKGCSDTLIKSINVYGAPDASFIFEYDTCRNEAIFFNTSTNAQTYFWQFGDGNSSTSKNPVYIFQEGDTNHVSLIINKGTVCSDTVEHILITPLKFFGGIYIPNCFTPNEDNLNDKFEAVINHQCQEYHFQFMIFNRWGELIFSTETEPLIWNGKFNNKIVQQGVYSYLLKINGEFIKRGRITVLR